MCLWLLIRGRALELNVQPIAMVLHRPIFYLESMFDVLSELVKGVEALLQVVRALLLTTTQQAAYRTSCPFRSFETIFPFVSREMKVRDSYE